MHSVHSRVSDPAELYPLFFENKVLNSGFVVKHRLRAFERDEVDTPRHTATKVLLPIDISDLRAGARSIFVGQRDFDRLCQSQFGDAIAPGSHDRRILELLDQLPSLDPFLMREHLRRNGVEPARAYFSIADADIQRMHAFVQREIFSLADMCKGDSTDAQANAVRLVDKLLSDDRAAEFKPLQETLRLSDQAYQDGIFAWRGFLYYKWVLSEVGPSIPPIVKEIQAAKPRGETTPETKAYISTTREKVVEHIGQIEGNVRTMLGAYNTAYRGLTGEGKPTTFRQFLLSAPTMFVTLGEQLGALQHVASFWKYRFPEGVSRGLTNEDFAEVLQDFEESLIGEAKVKENTWT